MCQHTLPAGHGVEVMKTALVVEDHEDTRKWLGELLEQAFASIQVTPVATLEDARAILPDAMRTALLPLPALPREQEANDRDDLETLLLGTRQEVTVSFLRANAQGQPKTPSPWLRHLFRVCTGLRELPWD